MWMISTPAVRNDYFQKVWEEAREAIQDGELRLPGEEC
jgi:hypothetical protein